MRLELGEEPGQKGEVSQEQQKSSTGHTDTSSQKRTTWSASAAFLY